MWRDLPGLRGRQTSGLGGLRAPWRRQAGDVLVTRAAAAAAVVVVSAGLLSGCSDGRSQAARAPTPTSAAALPDNLCEPVLGAVSADWQLTEDSHRTEQPTAVCELTGPRDTSLRVTLTDFPDRAGAAAA